MHLAARARPLSAVADCEPPPRLGLAQRRRARQPCTRPTTSTRKHRCVQVDHSARAVRSLTLTPPTEPVLRPRRRPPHPHLLARARQRLPPPVDLQEARPARQPRPARQAGPAHVEPARRAVPPPRARAGMARRHAHHLARRSDQVPRVGAAWRTWTESVRSQIAAAKPGRAREGEGARRGVDLTECARPVTPHPQLRDVY